MPGCGRARDSAADVGQRRWRGNSLGSRLSWSGNSVSPSHGPPMTCLNFCFLFLCGALAVTGSLAADDFPAPHNAGAGAEGLPLDAEQAAKGFQLPPGFRAQVFAAEPDVQNPVAMTW